MQQGTAVSWLKKMRVIDGAMSGPALCGGCWMMQLTNQAGRNKMEIKDYQLMIFDVDGTIANRDEDRLLPEARDFFKLLYEWSAVATLPKLALATNQGGVGLRWW